MDPNCCFRVCSSNAIVAVLLLVGDAFAVNGKQPANRVLSEEPWIELKASVLSSEEAQDLRALASKIGLEGVDSMQGDVTGGEDYVALREPEPDAEDQAEQGRASRGWAAAARLEELASKWHPSETAHPQPVFVTRWDRWAPSMALNRSGLLHLDGRRARWRRYTMLTYLSGTGHVDDGYTVFPCVETDEMEAKEAKRRSKLCSRAARHVQQAHDQLLRIREEGLFLSPEGQGRYMLEHPELAALAAEDEEGVRAVDWRWTFGHDTAADNVDSLHALAESMCRGEALGLRVAPVVGAALFFESASKDRSGKLIPDWRLWHAGCSPRGGRRWTAQVFVEDRTVLQVAARSSDLVAGEQACDSNLVGDSQSKCANSSSS